MSSAVIYGVLGSPPTRSALLTAKIVGLVVNLKPVSMVNQEHKSENYLKVNPNHTIPTFVDADGFTLWDSHAIVTYLVDKYAKDDSLYPKDPKKRALVDNMLHFDNSCLWTSLHGHFSAQMFLGKKYDADREAVVTDRLTTLNAVLGQRTYAAGEQLTVADLCLINSVGAIKSFGSAEVENFPNIVRWRNKVEKEVKYYDEIVGKGAQVLQDIVQSLKAHKA